MKSPCGSKADPFSRRVALAAAIGAALAGAAPALAQDGPQSEVRPGVLSRIQVVDGVEGARESAGSAQYIEPGELERFEFTDINRVLRQVPGVYLVEEEGYGLRPNIGIRGSGIDRNSRITVMEDGVLIAPAVYSAPAAYYFPTMARIHAVEIRKGSAAIQNGPRTTGGAINLVSTPIPEAALQGKASLLFGEDSTTLGHAWLGGTTNGLGFLVETVQQRTDGFKELDGGGDTGYDLQDYLVKLAYTTDPSARFAQRVELRFSRNDQDSNDTYLGLTNADFAATPNRRYAASALDNIQVEHTDKQLRHSIRFSDSLDLSTVLYRHDTERAWYKLQDVTGGSLSAVLADPAAFALQYGWLTGADSPDNALRIRNNNRAYQAQGLQSVLGWRLPGDAAVQQLQIGVRHHEDEEDRFQQDDRYRMQGGRLVLTTAGAPGSQDNRVGEAQVWSAFVRNEIGFGYWTVTPGVRYERIELTQTRYATQPNGRDLPPTAISEHTVTQVIPGIGLVREFDGPVSLFGSVSRGFNPPGPGSTADAEKSVNYELGMRYAAGGLFGELAGFYNDYANLVGTCTASTGGNCSIGDQFDGGKARVHGVEAGLGWVINEGRAISFPLRAAWTWTSGEFRSSFASGFEEWGNVIAGDELPYLPEHLFSANAGVHAGRWQADLSVSYVGEMREVAGRGRADPRDRTESAFIVDLAASWRIVDTFELFGRVENLFDETYIAAHRPSGARPGKPRTALAGIRYSF